MQYKCTVKNTLCRKAAEIYMSQDPHWTPHPPPPPPPPPPSIPPATHLHPNRIAGRCRSLQRKGLPPQLFWFRLRWTS